MRTHLWPSLAASSVLALGLAASASAEGIEAKSGNAQEPAFDVVQAKVVADERWLVFLGRSFLQR